MQEAFDAALCTKPQTIADYFRCAYRSLALCYKNALQELQQNTGKHYEEIYIVGGGARNTFLNKLTEEVYGMKVCPVMAWKCPDGGILWVILRFSP